jgi:excisionase family DNA binding protein
MNDSLNPLERPTLTIDEAAEVLGVSRSSGYNAAASGDLPTIRVGRRLLVPTAALRRMLHLDLGVSDLGTPAA